MRSARHQTYGWITFAAVLCDVNTVLHIAAEVIGLSPATVTSFRVERPYREQTNDMMEWLRKSRLVGSWAVVLFVCLRRRTRLTRLSVPVDRGVGLPPYRVELENVSFVREAHSVESYMLAAAYLITSQPTTLLAIVLSPTWRLVGVGLSIFSLFKVQLCGSWMCRGVHGCAFPDPIWSWILVQNCSYRQPDEWADLLVRTCKLVPTCAVFVVPTAHVGGTERRTANERTLLDHAVAGDVARVAC